MQRDFQQDWFVNIETEAIPTSIMNCNMNINKRCKSKLIAAVLLSVMACSFINILGKLNGAVL